MEHKNGRQDGRTVTTEAVINVLDHFFPAFMFKVHIDIGWFVAFFGKKRAKSKLDLSGATEVMPSTKHTAELAADPLP
jgi:hypothetical protein